MSTGHRFPCIRRLFDNGMRLIVASNTHVPLVSVNAYVLAGADQNPPGRAGLADMTSRLLDEGSRLRSADAISREIESTGGQLQAFSQRELSGISFQGAAESLPTALEVIHEMLTQPVFPEKAFLLEKDRMLNDALASEDDPQAVAARHFHAAVYRGSPFAYPPAGTLRSLTRIRRSDVKAFHSNFFAPPNTILAVVGDIDAQEVATRVADRFGDWERTKRVPPAPRPAARARKARTINVDFDSEQLHIAVGHLGVTRLSPDYHRLQVLDLILGSGPGFTSRIPRVLRDELGLTYFTYSNIVGSASIYPGHFVFYASTSPPNENLVLERFGREVAEIQAGRFSDEELSTAQDYLTGNFVFDFESNYNVAWFLLASELFELGADYPERYPAIIRAVSREDVIRVANRYIHLDKAIRVLVGSRSTG